MFTLSTETNPRFTLALICAFSKGTGSGGKAGLLFPTIDYLISH